MGDIWRKTIIEFTKLAKVSYKLLSYGVIPDPFLDLRSSKMEQMKGIDVLKNKCLVQNILLMLVGDIWRKPLIELTKLAKISCKLLSYGAIPDLLPDLRSSKMEQMKGINVLKNNFLAGTVLSVPLGDISTQPLI